MDVCYFYTTHNCTKDRGMKLCSKYIVKMCCIVLVYCDSKDILAILSMHYGCQSRRDNNAKNAIFF